MTTPELPPILRARYDSWHDAGRWRAILLGAVKDPREDRTVRWDPSFLSWLDRHEEAKVGDVWTFRRRPTGPGVVSTYRERDSETWHWPVTHYGLVCPVETCEYGVHVWDHAHNCPARETFGVDCRRGARRTSCWDWTGTIEQSDLTASPSLQILPIKPTPVLATHPVQVTRQTCQFHGKLLHGLLA